MRNDRWWSGWQPGTALQRGELPLHDPRGHGRPPTVQPTPERIIGSTTTSTSPSVPAWQFDLYVSDEADAIGDSLTDCIDLEVEPTTT